MIQLAIHEFMNWQKKLSFKCLPNKTIVDLDLHSFVDRIPSHFRQVQISIESSDLSFSLIQLRKLWKWGKIKFKECSRFPFCVNVKYPFH